MKNMSSSSSRRRRRSTKIGGVIWPWQRGKGGESVPLVRKDLVLFARPVELDPALGIAPLEYGMIRKKAHEIKIKNL